MARTELQGWVIQALKAKGGAGDSAVQRKECQSRWAASKQSLRADKPFLTRWPA